MADPYLVAAIIQRLEQAAARLQDLTISIECGEYTIDEINCIGGEISEQILDAADELRALS
jgi:hypothetical protein